jgi:hypothetical protein
MAIQMKDTASIAAKFASRASAAAPEYKTGVDTTTADWAALTVAAGENYEQGVTQAISRKAFQKGVTAKGTQGWKDKASTVGASRYGTGVSGAGSAYAAGFAKSAQILSSLTLPPRGPKGAPQNIQRVQTVADALHRGKVG